MNDFSDLAKKIAEAKPRLPLPKLIRQLGYDEKHIGKTSQSPFHSDEHPSFSVFQGKDGFWHYKCFVCDSCGGDEIAFLVKHFNASRREAIRRYLEMAGFPSHRSKSREYPELLKPHGSRESLSLSKAPEFRGHPVSNGQGLEGELKALAARNACTESNTARSRRWQLVRDLRAVERGIGRELKIRELMPVFEEWHRLSQPFLDPAKTRDAYLAAFLKELRKIRVPTGEGDTLNKALERVSTLSVPELPIIPDYPGRTGELAQSRSTSPRTV